MTKRGSDLGDNGGRCESCDRPESVHEAQTTYPVRLGGGLGWGTMWLCPACLKAHYDAVAVWRAKTGRQSCRHGAAGVVCSACLNDVGLLENRKEKCMDETPKCDCDEKAVPTLVKPGPWEWSYSDGAVGKLSKGWWGQRHIGTTEVHGKSFTLAELGIHVTQRAEGFFPAVPQFNVNTVDAARPIVADIILTVTGKPMGTLEAAQRRAEELHAELERLFLCFNEVVRRQV